jgi:hypothetical protein
MFHEEAVRLLRAALVALREGQAPPMVMMQIEAFLAQLDRLSGRSSSQNGK